MYFSGGFVLPPCITSNPGQTSIGGVLLDVVGAIIARDASNLHPTIMGFDGANHILEAGSTGATTSPGVFLINYYLPNLKILYLKGQLKQG